MGGQLDLPSEKNTLKKSALLGLEAVTKAINRKCY